MVDIIPTLNRKTTDKINSINGGHSNMIKKIRESKMIDFDIVFIVSAVLICLIMAVAVKAKEIDFSITDIYAEAIPKNTITSSNTLGEVEGTIESSVTFSNGELINTTYGIGNNKPIYTTAQITDYILGKGNELISILQVIAQPLCIIVFIVGCGIALIGALSGAPEKGLIPMAAAAIIYTCILFASSIINVLPSFIIT